MTRRALSPAQHRLRGTKPRTERLPVERPLKPLTARTPPPPWLSADAQTVWRELLRALPTSFAGEADIGALANLASMQAEYREMDNRIGTGTLVADPETGKVMLNPLVRARNSLLIHIRQLQCEFGLTPRSRAALAAVGALSIRPGDTDEDEARADQQRKKQANRYRELATKYGQPKLVTK